MRTMYKVEERVYTDCEGRNTDWYVVKNSPWVDTTEEARAIAATVKKNSGWTTGDWRIVERTMDEKTFTMIDVVVEQFDWWKEVGRYENAKWLIVTHEEDIAELEANKARCKTTNGIAKKDKEIAWHKEIIEKAKMLLAEKN